MRKKAVLAGITVLLSAAPASWGDRKLSICHYPPGNRANWQFLTIGASAVPHHIGNHAGDKEAYSPDECSGTIATPGDENPN